MRALALPAILALVVLLAGCAEEAGRAPLPPTPEPEAACDARGIPALSCGAFCDLHPTACGLLPPTPAPYPAHPLLPTPTDPAPSGALPSPPLPTPPGGAAPSVPGICVLVPSYEACPQP